MTQICDNVGKGHCGQTVMPLQSPAVPAPPDVRLPPPSVRGRLLEHEMIWYKEWANSDAHPNMIAAGFWGATVFRCLCRISAEFDLDGKIPNHYFRPHYIANRLQLIAEQPICCGERDETDAVAWVELGIDDAEKAELIAIRDGTIYLNGWEERQVASSGAMTNTERSQEFRRRQREAKESRNAPATGSNGVATEALHETTEEKREEENRGEENTLSSNKDDLARQMQELWNAKAPPKCARWQRMTAPRRKAATARALEGSRTPQDALKWWEGVLDAICASAFLRGDKTDWQADIDWVLKPANLVKLEEGKYKTTEQVHPSLQMGDFSNTPIGIVTDF